MNVVRSLRDLRVHQKLCELHVAIHELSMGFPKFELYELGSQMRRSSNSAAAILAEGWGSRHTNMYIEAINRALGEVRETQHHVSMALAKRYLSAERHAERDGAYEMCGRMLEPLHQALSGWSGTTRTGNLVREALGDETTVAWASATVLTWRIDAEIFSPAPNTQHPTPAPS